MYRLRALLILLISWLPLGVAADEPFVVRDIQVEGLQRIAEGTVFTYLPVNIGDRMEEDRVGEAMRALYDTGFFEDVELRREDGTLVVVVVERPYVQEITIKGNEEVETEDLLNGLRDIGLAEGRVFDPAALDRVEQSLTGLFLAYGKYAAKVDIGVEELSENTVAVSITIDEGRRALIRQINIVGNRVFSDDELLAQLSLQPRSLWARLSGADQYSKEALDADLERLRSFYFDRGYADFTIASSSISISPEKDALFVTIEVEEGDQFTISSVELEGDVPIPAPELERLILVSPGQIVSRRQIEQSAELISTRLGIEGYAYATVEPTPTLDMDRALAAIVFAIDPGERVYVRRIEFEGVDKTKDFVLRREIEQPESAYMNTQSVENSKQALQRLPHIGNVNVKTLPVAESEDLVDLEFEIEEQKARRYGGGGGFSDSQRVTLEGYFTNDNLFGKGRRVALDFKISELSSAFNFDHITPYRTPGGISRQISVRFRDIERLTAASSLFPTTTALAGLEYGYKVTSRQRVRFGIAVRDSELETSSTEGSLQSLEWVTNNGNSSIRPDPAGPVASTQFFGLDLVGRWRFDSRDKAIFAERGLRQRFSVSTTAPGSDVEYYTLDYDLVKFWPLRGAWIARLHTRAAFGDAFGNKTTSIPPYLNWFAGGIGSVRGYRESRLGPKDSLGNPYGGNLVVATQFDLVMPVPERWRNIVRLSLFYDIGNVFSTGGVTFIDTDPNSPDFGQPIDYSFDFDRLKRSTGIAVDWRAPIGLLRFSYGIPLNADETNPSPFLRDEVDQFQFTIGVAF